MTNIFAELKFIQIIGITKKIHIEVCYSNGISEGKKSLNIPSIKQIIRLIKVN